VSGSQDSLRSFTALMRAWRGLLDLVAAEADLTAYTWQPRTMPQLPAIWNWLLPSTTEVRDTARIRDTVNLLCRIGFDHSEDGDDQLETLAPVVDVFRQIVDPHLWTPRTADNVVLQGTAYKAQRTGWQMESLEMSGAPVLVVSFNMQFDVDRRVAG
jgi:hypothetical protein